MTTNRLLLILLGFPVFGLTAEAPPEVTLYYYERMPFFGDADGEASGLLIDISRLIFDQAGIKYQFSNVPVIRFFEVLKKPGNSCVIGALRTRKRETLYAYSDDFIYRDHPFRIIINTGKRKSLPERPTIRQVLDSKLRLGVADGYVYGEWLDKKIIEHQPRLEKVNIGNDTEKMHQMIIGDRFDYMFAVAEEAKYVVAKEHAERLTSVEIADAPRGNMRYLLCSKGIDSALMTKINAAIRSIKSSSDYERMIDPQD